MLDTNYQDNQILQNNLNSIKILTDLFDKLDDRFYPLEESKDGNYTIKVDNVYQHSRYDPIKEAKRIVEVLLNDLNDIDVIILFGNGLGYILREIYDIAIKKSSKKIKPYIIYIEKDLKIFFSALSVYDYTNILQDENVKFFLDAEKELIGSFIQSIPTKRTRYYYHRPSFLLNEEYYKELQNYLNYVLDRKDMNSATLKRFQKLWSKNFISNLPYFVNSNSIANLKDIAKGTTAIVVAGGPNLERSIEFLKKNCNHCVVIAVDTVYKYLKKNNICVDIIVTVDPQFWNYKYLENVTLTGEIVVTDSSTYYKIFRMAKPNRIFVPNSIFQLAKYFEVYDRGVLAAGGSVATAAFDIARIIGSKEIFLIGLDLSFPKRKTHFKGAFFETNFLTFSTYFNTAESNSYRYLTDMGLTKVKSTSGFVETDGRMILFKKGGLMREYSNQRKVYSPNMGGVAIDGTLVVDIENSRMNSNKSNFVNSLQKIILDNRELPQDHLQKLTSS